MATYGISFYGVETYGYSGPLQFDATPMVAEALGYDSVDVTWRSPAGTWDELRIVRNWNGFPSDENDGDVVASFDGPAAQTIDSGVRPGAWHYYAVFVHSTSGWSRAAVCSTLMLQDHGYSDRLFENLPRHFRLLSGALDDGPTIENDDLRSFLKVLAVGLDYIKTYYDNLRVLNDPMRNHLAQLIRLAEQLGIEYLPATPPHLFRSRVQNATTLAREKGTLEQVRTVIGMSVGWDVEIKQGPNLMLNEDTASFIHPIWDDWDPARNYPAGERVSFNGFTYEAKAGGAYGEAQKPSGLTTSNTWWTYVSQVRDQTFVEADGAVAGWGAVSYTNGVSVGAFAVAMGLGVQSPTDPTVNGKNCLWLANNVGVSADFGVTSIKPTDAESVVKRGVPIPSTRRKWSSTGVYLPGDVTVHEGTPYRAVTKSIGANPSTSPAWEVVGVDRRPLMTSSVFVKGGTGGSAQSRLSYPTAEFYDDKGNLIAAVDTTKVGSPNVFDSLSTPSALLSGRTTDVGALTWSELFGAPWLVRGAAYPSDPTVDSFAYLDGLANGRISVTFDAPGFNSKKQAVVVRWVGGASNNLSTASFIRVTRTAIETYNAGTVTPLVTFATPFQTGDRVTVSFVGSTLKVWRNGVTAATTSSSLNTSATRHGILVA